MVLPLIAGMMAPSLLAGMGIAALPAAFLGSAAGSLLEKGKLDPRSIALGTIGGGVVGPQLSGLFGAGASASPTALASGYAGPQSVAGTAPLGMANLSGAGLGNSASGGLGSLGGLMTPQNVMLAGLGTSLLGSFGGSGGSPKKEDRKWRREAPAPGVPASVRPIPGGGEANWRVPNTSAARIDAEMDPMTSRALRNYARGGPVGMHPAVGRGIAAAAPQQPFAQQQPPEMAQTGFPMQAGGGRFAEGSPMPAEGLSLPPGLAGRPLPPGLRGRPLPPGLARRAGLAESVAPEVMPEAPAVDPAAIAPASPVVPDVVDTTGVINAPVAPWGYENTGWWGASDRTAPRGWWENPYVSYRGNFATGGDTADDSTLIPAQPMRYLSALQDAPRGVTEGVDNAIELQKWYMRGYGPSGSLPESANYPPEMLAKAKAMGLAGLRPSGIIRTSVPDELRKMIEERNKIDPLPKEPSTSEGDSQSLRDEIWERQQNAGGGIGGDYGDSRGLDDAGGGIGAGAGAGVGDYGGPGDAYSGDPSYGSEYGRAKGGVVRYAEGGEAAGSITDALNPEDPLVANAVDAISGNLSQDEATLAMGALLEALTQRYGKEQANMLLRELVGIVSQGGMSGPAAEFGADTSREIPDQGRDMDGMSDMTPANIIPSESRNYAKGGNARVTEGEYIVSNADLSAAGNGDREAGVSKLESLLGSLREDHYGTRRHPNATNFEQVAGRVFS